jgi:hypothetical protein
MKFSANEQAKELITIFYPGSDIAQDMVDMAIGSRDDWRWERAHGYWQPRRLAVGESY